MQQYTTKPATVRAYRYDGPESRPANPDPLAHRPVAYELPEYPGVLWGRDRTGLHYLPGCGGLKVEEGDWLVDWKNGAGGGEWQAMPDGYFRERFTEVAVDVEALKRKGRETIAAIKAGTIVIDHTDTTPRREAELVASLAVPEHLLTPTGPTDYNYAAAVMAEEQYTGRPHLSTAAANLDTVKAIDEAAWRMMDNASPEPRKVNTTHANPFPEVPDSPPE